MKRSLILYDERVNEKNEKEELFTLEVETFVDCVEIEIEDEANFRAVCITLDEGQVVTLVKFLSEWVNQPGP